MNIQYPTKFSLGRLSTPLQALDRLSEKIGGPRIWVKRDDMNGFATSGNKLRKLEYLLKDAKAKGCDTLVTQGAFQSNHCRATALLGVKMGFKTSLLLLGDLDSISEKNIPDANLFIDLLTGVDITYFDMDSNIERLDEILEEKIDSLKKEGHKPYKIPAGATTPLGLWGYIECSKELKADFEQEQINPKYIVHTTGTAGTQAGLTLGNKMYNLGTEIWGVAVWQDKNHFEKISKNLMREWGNEFGTEINIDNLTINTIDDYVGQAYSQPDAEIYETIKMVAQQEAIILDPVYTGRGFHGMLESIRNGKFADTEDIVFLHTGGFLGLFAQRDKFSFD